MSGLGRQRVAGIGACAAVLVGLFVGVLQADDRLTRLDGTVVTGAVQSISAAGEVQGAGLPAGLALDDLQSLAHGGEVEKPAAAGSFVLEFAGGVKLPAKEVLLADEKVNVLTLAAEARLSLPLEGVRAVHFNNSAPPAEVTKALAEPNNQHDRVFVKIDGQLQSLTGLVEGLSADKLDLLWEKQKRSLPRENLVALVFAGGKAEPARCLVQLGEAGSIPAASVSLAGETLTAALAGGGKVDLPWKLVQRVDVRSAKLQFLSDLEPVEAQQEAIVAQARPWQRDKSVLGRPLTLGKETFNKGLGVQSRSRLTFAADEKFRTFATTIGIDAETQGRGDCEFVVLADGQELARKRMRGSDPPQVLALDISGRRRVTLLVEPGEDLDLADHADWAQARFVK